MNPGLGNSIHLAIDLLLFQHDPRIPVSDIVSETSLLITRYMPTKLTFHIIVH